MGMFERKTNPRVFWGASGIVAVLLAAATLAPGASDVIFSSAQGWVIETFGWFYVAVVAGFLAFVVFIAVGPTGRIKLGADDAEPDFPYLSWLAIQAFRSGPLAVSPAEGASSGAMRAWRAGMLVNLLNPKVAIFILAFVPQFVDPARGSGILQFLLLGGILIAGGTVVNALVGMYAGKVGRFFRKNARAGLLFQRLSGVVFVGLAAKLALERR